MDLRSTQEKDIDGCSYAVTQLGALKGSKVFVRVLKVLGPAFASKDPAAFFDGLKEEDVEYLCSTFSPMTFVKGGQFPGPLDKTFDFHFAGRYGALVQWLLFCVQVNFGDFLKGKGLGLGVGAPKASSGSDSQMASTGPAGVS